MRILSSAEFYLCILRQMSPTTFSVGFIVFIDFCFIFVAFGHYDEPELLRYKTTSVCPKGADVEQ